MIDVGEMLTAAARLADPGTASESLDSCLVHLTGDLLPGWYEDWVVIERERLRQVRLHALETLAHRFTSAHIFDKATEAAIAAVKGEPLRESANTTLIEVFLAEGNIADAMRHYRRYRRLLLSELGVAPSRDLQDVVRVIGRSMTTR
jgi:DNA-binding SARP family transcriptional activator